MLPRRRSQRATGMRKDGRASILSIGELWKSPNVRTLLLRAPKARCFIGFPASTKYTNFGREGQRGALGEALVGAKPYAHDVFVVFGFGRARDFSAVGGEHAPAATPAGFALILARPHLRILTTELGEFWRELDGRLFALALGLHDADI